MKCISPEHSSVESHHRELTFRHLPALECLQSSLGLLLDSTSSCAGNQAWCYLEDCYPFRKEKSAHLLPQGGVPSYDSWNSQILKFASSFRFKYIRDDSETILFCPRLYFPPPCSQKFKYISKNTATAEKKH